MPERHHGQPHPAFYIQFYKKLVAQGIYRPGIEPHLLGHFFIGEIGAGQFQKSMNGIFYQDLAADTTP